ncbi:HAD-IA family hydrolase [Rhodopirellula sp. JC740]|uniref:HAD-IA family hydrolase n=1 Tax=Rhodopirellula halodulae TaxID=2894198 RepID=A0ABS8NFL6_9BACT|nr:HAD-IA family hydrolase [Rhodopirellula sp. JC740]MCC9642340.1 HAD-IA family hydrolase [Rhodopirellula sp. JC740]
MFVRGVALDMDGLLFDTERIYFRVGQVLMERRGHTFTLELQQKMMGRVGLSAIGQMIEHHSLDDDPVALLAESDDVYGDLLLGELRPMPGLDAWVDRLRESGLPFGLATSSRRKFVDMILPTTGWSDELAFVLTGDDVTHGKPNPEMYLKAAERLAMPAKQMLVLEDSGNGAAAAVSAGAVTVAVPNEHTRGHEFSGVHLVADSLEDSRLWGLLPEPGTEIPA